MSGCPTCRGLNPRRKLELTLAAFDLGAKKGCQLCYAIVTAVDGYVNPSIASFEGKRFVNRDLSTILLVHGALLRIVATIESGYRDVPDYFTSKEWNIELYVEPGKPSPWPVFKPAKKVTTQLLNSDRRKKRIRSWIDNCVSSHQDCNRVFQAPQIDGTPAPKRLLEMGTNPRNGLQVVDADGSVPFVAVAYKGAIEWPASLKEIYRNFDAGRNGIDIPWWRIPPAVQDALVIASGQGIRHVWVPYLCIDFKDTEDWAWHMDRLAVILPRARFTVVLSDDRDMNSSGLENRKPMSMLGDQAYDCLDIQLSQHGHHYHVYARPSMHWPHQILNKPRFSLDKYSTLALHEIFGNMFSFQQIMLSPRVLHLRRTEMVWDCLHACECECMVLGHHERAAKTTQKYWDFVAEVYNDDQARMSRIIQPYMRLWSKGRPEERLRGINGLLQAMYNLGCGPRTFGGLACVGSAPKAQELLWNFVIELHKESKLGDNWPTKDWDELTKEDFYKSGTLIENGTHRHATPKIPSWSWASMVFERNEPILGDTGLLWPHKTSPLNLSPELSLREATASSSRGPNSSDAVTLLMLQVRGKVLPAKLSTKRTEITAKLGNVTVLTWHFTFGPAMSSETIRVAGRFRADDEEFGRRLMKGKVPPSAHLLLLGSVTVIEPQTPYPPDDADFQSAQLDVGLVLRQVESTHAGRAFERLGVFTVPVDYRYFDGAEVQDLTLV